MFSKQPDLATGSIDVGLLEALITSFYCRPQIIGDRYEALNFKVDLN